jgi:hypothetical protein
MPGTTDWLLIVLLVWGGSAFIYWIGKHNISIRWGIRWGTLSIIGGMTTYALLVLLIPTESTWYEEKGLAAAMVLTGLGMLCGWLLGWIWQQQNRTNLH